MEQETINAIADAVAERILRDLPRGRVPITPEYLTAEQVAQMTGFSPKALEAYRAKRIGPNYLKVGHNVRYRADDVRAWVEAGGRWNEWPSGKEEPWNYGDRITVTELR